MASTSGLSFDPDHTTVTSMDPPSPSSPPTIQFPVTKVVDEMDFFAADHAQDDSICSAPNSVLDLKVNTGLHLHTTGSDDNEGTTNDRVSSNNSDNNKRSKTSEVASLQAEMERINTENRQLREMLNQATNNCNGLQMHLLNVMQQFQEKQQSNQKIDNNHRSGGLPRQFIDLGLAPTQPQEDEEGSLSSSDCRTSRLPPSDPQGGGDEHCPQNKAPRIANSPRPDQATEATMRKARVSVRARSEAPMITDGCQWRKYGQKMAKGNPCPRAYYRCTMAAGCPVRKQVQRCADDKSILVTTYEGNHNHPLPPAAMAMASTTSSAARMLLSGSMPSADGIMNSSFLARTLLPCSSSMATISASAPFPTVTLDLTQSPNPLQFPRPSNQFSLPFLNPPQDTHPAASLLPQIFGQALYNQSKFSGLQMSQEIDQQANNNNHHISPITQNQLSHDTINALAADPNFAAALAAAISSIIGARGGPLPNNGGSNVSGNNTTGNNK